jgi:hypothetical protein
VLALHGAGRNGSVVVHLHDLVDVEDTTGPLENASAIDGEHVTHVPDCLKFSFTKPLAMCDRHAA